MAPLEATLLANPQTSNALEVTWLIPESLDVIVIVPPVIVPPKASVSIKSTPFAEVTIDDVMLDTELEWRTLVVGVVLMRVVVSTEKRVTFGRLEGAPVNVMETVAVVPVGTTAEIIAALCAPPPLPMKMATSEGTPPILLLAIALALDVLKGRSAYKRRLEKAAPAAMETVYGPLPLPLSG